MKPERIEGLRERADSLVRGECPGYGEVLVPAHELLHLLRCARAVAELGEWLRGDAMRAMVLSSDQAEAHFPDTTEEFDMTTRDAKGPDLLTAIEAALARAKEASRG